MVSRELSNASNTDETAYWQRENSQIAADYWGGRGRSMHRLGQTPNLCVSIARRFAIRETVRVCWLFCVSKHRSGAAKIGILKQPVNVSVLGNKACVCKVFVIPDGYDHFYISSKFVAKSWKSLSQTGLRLHRQTSSLNRFINPDTESSKQLTLNGSSMGTATSSSTSITINNSSCTLVRIRQFHSVVLSCISFVLRLLPYEFHDYY